MPGRDQCLPISPTSTSSLRRPASYSGGGGNADTRRLRCLRRRRSSSARWWRRRLSVSSRAVAIRSSAIRNPFWIPRSLRGCAGNRSHAQLRAGGRVGDRPAGRQSKTNFASERRADGRSCFILPVRGRACAVATSGAWISGARETRGRARGVPESARVLPDCWSPHSRTARGSQECSRHPRAARIARRRCVDGPRRRALCWPSRMELVPVRLVVQARLARPVGPGRDGSDWRRRVNGNVISRRALVR
jgi:hypothetical protein